MSIDPIKALQLETDFLAGVEANFESAKGRDFRGAIWERAESDESDRLRALLAQNRVYDRERLRSLPSNRRVEVRGFERRLWLWKRRTGVAVASVLSPLSHYASGSGAAAPPIGLGELADHVRRQVSDSRTPHVIGICSPTGFTTEAREARLETANATVILIEPDGSGGWRTFGVGDSVDPRLLRIFDPEGAKQKLERVRRAVEERSTDLLTGGVSASSLSRSLRLPEDVVREGIEEIVAADPELRTLKMDGEFLLFRGAMAVPSEKRGMNVIDRIRQLFSREGEESAKINVLAERRAALAQRRDRIYEEIGKLEGKYEELNEHGKNAKSDVVRRRLAAQVAQLKKDIGRQNTTAAMLNQQLNIISTDIHNLTLIQQGQLAELPETTELTEHAVEAEELLETLRADAELVASLGTGMETSLVSEDEQAILKEWQGVAEKPAVARSTPTATPAKAPERAPIPRTASEAPAPAPVKDASRRPADPEATA